MIVDYKFFMKESTLNKMNDPNFSGLHGTAIIYFAPINSKFEDEIKLGKDTLQEVKIEIKE